MSDLVERLHNLTPLDDPAIGDEAADEIERLRAVVEAAESDDHEWYLQAKETERLRAALEEIASDKLYNEAQMTVIAEAALEKT